MHLNEIKIGEDRGKQKETETEKWTDRETEGERESTVQCCLQQAVFRVFTGTQMELLSLSLWGACVVKLLRRCCY